MFKSLGFSLQGKDHIDHGIPCQDYHAFFHLNDHCVIAIVADGVGSAKLSDVGAKVAVETALDYLKNNLIVTDDDQEVMSFLEEAYQKAFKQVQSLAKDFRCDIEEFDTTLTTAIIMPNKTYYGHSGDGGIVLLLESGLYEKLTVPQKGPEGGRTVIPLRESNQWEFGVTEESIAAVLLATDGVYDTFFPALIQSEPIHIYVHRIEKFMNIDQSLSMEEHKTSFIHMTDSPNLRDDRTLVLILNTDKNIQRQEESYYAIPDWKSLQKKYLKTLYPNLTEEEIDQYIQIRNNEPIHDKSSKNTEEKIEENKQKEMLDSVNKPKEG